ncbi:MAG: hypothetical protein LBJ10_11400, partial [Clostridiales bacterium]|jgi:hypothetical protein|nr:hypothetical protein [Clostridiales bacterium]
VITTVPGEPGVPDVPGEPPPSAAPPQPGDSSPLPPDGSAPSPLAEPDVDLSTLNDDSPPAEAGNPGQTGAPPEASQDAPRQTPRRTPPPFPGGRTGDAGAAALPWLLAGGGSSLAGLLLALLKMGRGKGA